MRAAFLAAAVWGALAAVAMAQGVGQGGANPIDRLMAADANGDGALSKAEARAGREGQFRRVDTNGDGFITAEERAARAEKKKKRGGAGGGDADGDGKVSRAEFLDAPYRGFDMFDANKNDVLEAAEIQAARDRFLQRKTGTP